MTQDQEGRSSSPVHVTVDDTTPVHVHLKKPKKPGMRQSRGAERQVEIKTTKAAAAQGASNLRRSAGARSRSKSPSQKGNWEGHWVPPPAKTSTGGKLSWKGPAHRLEINTSDDAEAIQTTLKVSDLDTDDEDRVTNSMRKYEQKIDSLMSEVGTLKNEVELQRSKREIDIRDEELDVSRRVLEHQDSKLRVIQSELEMTETENKMLRKNVDRLRDDVDINRSAKQQAEDERERLMNMLVEVEMDGQAAAKQVSALRDILRRLREESRWSSTDSSMLAKQRELLLERLNDFESTNRTLRRMLRDRHEAEGANVRLAEQRDVLLRKLTETEDRVQSLRGEVLDRDRVVADLRMAVDSQKEENLGLNGLQSSLESTRAHLQKQLRQKEADCNRMAVQIRSIESQLAQERIDNDHLQGLLGTAKEKADRDKEALKKATRVQKQRATRSEDALEQLNAQLLEKDSILAELSGESDSVRARSDKLHKEKSQAIAENTALKTRIAELESIMEHLEDDTKTKVETTLSKLQDKSSEATTVRLENDRLRSTIATLEDKMSTADSEVTQLRTSVRQYETLVDEYRSQMNKSRREADETMLELEDQKRESSRMKQDSQIEMDKVKSRLQARLLELEPLPELLKTTELKLHDANEQIHLYERRHGDNTKLIAELTGKVEQQNNQVDAMRQRMHKDQDGNRQLEGKLDGLERKLRDIEEQNRELLTNIAKREEIAHQSNMRLDEKIRENSSLQRQLEATQDEVRRLSESSREKAAAKERASQARVLELESQVSQLRAEIARIKREKEEAERKFNSRLYDLKDRLEQSHSTNRSMQNYVQFLKSSYANTFGDPSIVTSSPIRPGTNGFT